MAIFQKGNKQMYGGGKNTSRFITPSKDNPLQVVPLVDFEYNGKDPSILGYRGVKIWWDKDSVEERRKELEDEGVEGFEKTFQSTAFPIFCSDPEIDVGTWLVNNPEVIENAKVKPSTRFRKKDEPAIRAEYVHLVPVLWINDPDLNDTLEAFEPRLLKYTQSTIHEGFEIYYRESGGMFKGNRFSIQMAKDGKKYVVNGFGEYHGYMPELDFDPEELIGLTTRKEIEERLALYGIEVPPVPPEKLHILAALEGTEQTDDAEDEWDE